jgi:hypothetical protein
MVVTLTSMVAVLMLPLLLQQMKQVKKIFLLSPYLGVGLGRVVRKVCQHPDDHELESQRWQ